jgi:hypothetical protein
MVWDHLGAVVREQVEASVEVEEAAVEWAAIVLEQDPAVAVSAPIAEPAYLIK